MNQQPTPDVCSPLTGVMHSAAANLTRLQTINSSLKILIDSLDAHARKCDVSGTDTEPKAFPGVITVMQQTQEFTSLELDDVEQTIRTLQSLIG